MPATGVLAAAPAPAAPGTIRWTIRYWAPSRSVNDQRFIKSVWIGVQKRIVPHVCICIDAADEPYRIALRVPSYLGIIISLVVVIQFRFRS
jgi:hypothetical protein